MSDWDYLHDMHNDGYSPEDIADAASCGYNPDEYSPDKRPPTKHHEINLTEKQIEDAVRFGYVHPKKK